MTRHRRPVPAWCCQVMGLAPWAPVWRASLAGGTTLRDDRPLFSGLFRGSLLDGDLSVDWDQVREWALFKLPQVTMTPPPRL